jgi:hypothetical protein
LIGPARRASLTIAGRAAAIGVATLLLVACGPAASDPDASLAASGGGVESPTAEASTAAASASAPEPSAPPLPAGWELVFEEGHAERVVLATDVATDGSVTVAVGVVVHTSILHVGPYVREARIWVSSNHGTTWEPVPAEQFGNAHLSRVIAADDGFHVFGSTEPSDPAIPFSPFLVWHSTDGRAWDPVPFGEFDSARWSMTDLAVGPHGWVMIGSYSSESEPFYREEQIWHSADGGEWELVRASRQQLPLSGQETYRAAAAGPEGFVVIGGYALEGGDRPLILASADGRSWEVAPEQEALAQQDAPLAVASLASDWVITGGRIEGDIHSSYVPVWRSANGLDWELSAQITDPLSRPEYGWGTSLTSTGERLFLTAGLSGFADPQEAGVSTSTDARTWTAVDIDPAAAVVAALSFEDTYLLVGHIATRESRAAIWVGRPE